MFTARLTHLLQPLENVKHVYDLITASLSLSNCLKRLDRWVKQFVLGLHDIKYVHIRVDVFNKNKYLYLGSTINQPTRYLDFITVSICRSSSLL